MIGPYSVLLTEGTGRTVSAPQERVGCYCGELKQTWRPCNVCRHERVSRSSYAQA